MTLKSSILFPISLILCVQAPSAMADSFPSAEVGSSWTPTVDVELDPIAYALDGYSLHAGFTWNRVRLDLGAFALEVPETLHGTDGLEVYGSGFGAKFDYSPFAALPGLFVGAQLSRGREMVTSKSTRESRTKTLTNIGARIGYQIDITSGFYAVPWIGVDVALGDREQTVGAIEYAPSRVIVFPTIHVGKRF